MTTKCLSRIIHTHRKNTKGNPCKRLGYIWYDPLSKSFTYDDKPITVDFESLHLIGNMSDYYGEIKTAFIPL